MLLHAIPYNYNFPHTCQISDISQLVNSLTQLYNSSLPQMEILSIRLPLVLICCPPTISDEAFIAIARLQLMIGVALKPQSWLSAVSGGSRQEYWSGLPFPSPGIFPTQRWNPRRLCLLHWQAGSLPQRHLGHIRIHLGHPCSSAECVPV